MQKKTLVPSVRHPRVLISLRFPRYLGDKEQEQNKINDGRECTSESRVISRLASILVRVNPEAHTSTTDS